MGGRVGGFAVTGVAGEGAGVLEGGDGVVLPGLDAVAALFGVVWFGGEHADVLGEAGLVASVAGVAVGERGVPDDEVAGAGFDFDGRRDVGGEALVELLVAEVVVGEAVLGRPIGYPVVDAGDALEAALAGAGIDEVEDALD